MEKDLILVGLVALADPPRRGIEKASRYMLLLVVVCAHTFHGRVACLTTITTQRTAPQNTPGHRRLPRRGRPGNHDHGSVVCMLVLKTPSVAVCLPKG